MERLQVKVKQQQHQPLDRPFSSHFPFENLNSAQKVQGLAAILKHIDISFLKDYISFYREKRWTASVIYY